MWKKWMILSLLLLSFSNAYAGNLKLSFWNLEWFPGGFPDATSEEKQRHQGAVKPIIEHLNPDILGLEEVEDAAAVNSLIQKLPDFKLNVITGFTNREHTSRHQQMALLSRLPLLESGWEKCHLDQPIRGFAFAVYQLQADQVLLVYCVHLKSNRSDTSSSLNRTMRQETIHQLLDHQQKWMNSYRSIGKSIHVIIGGDFNTSLDDPLFEAEMTLPMLLQSGYQWAWQGIPLADRLTLPSHHSMFASVCFDHIFFRGFILDHAEMECVDRSASDHQPISATFEIPNPKD